MNLYDYNTVNRILTSHGFTFSKALGQNFIIDPEVCPAMADALSADEKTGALEIGPGIGVLTKELCKVCGKVASIELDKRLFPVLKETLSEFNNLEIIEGDVLKLNLQEIIKEKLGDMDSVKVCANLPYYITSPVIMSLLEQNLPIDEIIVMVQKEAAERLTAEIGSRESGAVTVAVNYYAEAEMLFEVQKTSFCPAPKVDSTVIRLKIRKKPAVKVENEEHFFKVVKAAFSQRRKTAVNCLSNGLGIPKAEISKALNTIGKNETSRAENFTMEEFARLSELL
ncbi:MAG: 16S rRNA (adenine(1518)-N(6)/adenine(1519)-N(6))-dimethyltransferase RsmA [Eubacterium sp.]|nr:16S rRNA (adenine(1518)-N(6)/adenine(1519)-N(6))-dimethyltransferase RsmA [Eubacterium sp.]